MKTCLAEISEEFREAVVNEHHEHRHQENNDKNDDSSRNDVILSGPNDFL